MLLLLKENWADKTLVFLLVYFAAQKNILWIVLFIVLLAGIELVMSNLPAARPGWDTLLSHYSHFFIVYNAIEMNCSSSQQQIIRGRDIINTNQFVGFPISCNGSKTCPGKCHCLLGQQVGQANTGNHFIIGFQDFGQCGVYSSFTETLIRVSCVSIATAGYLELQSTSSQSARKKDRNEWCIYKYAKLTDIPECRVLENCIRDGSRICI